MSISIVIPVRNEAQSIPLLYAKLMQLRGAIEEPIEVIFIENHSTDNTLNILSSLPEAKSISIYADEAKLSKGPALIAGFDHSSGNRIVCIDGDLQYDPFDIPKLLAKLDEGNDFAIGNRTDRKDRSSIRIVSVIGNMLRKVFQLSSVHDAGCGMFAITRDAAHTLRIPRDLYRFIPDILHVQGFSISEVSIPHYPRQYGTSKYIWTKCFRALTDLSYLTFCRICRIPLSALKNPSYIFIEDISAKPDYQSSDAKVVASIKM